MDENKKNFKSSDFIPDSYPLFNKKEEKREKPFEVYMAWQQVDRVRHCNKQDSYS